MAHSAQLDSEFQSTAQHRAGRNEAVEPSAQARAVSIHRPAQSRAEQSRRCSSRRCRLFQSTAQHRAGRNPRRPRCWRSGACFNPPPSTEPGGTGVGDHPASPSSFQSTAQHRAGRNITVRAALAAFWVSIHRPAQSRAELGLAELALAVGVSIHRPAQSRAELGDNGFLTVVGRFNPPPSTEPGGTGVAPSRDAASVFQSTAQHRAGRNAGRAGHPPCGSCVSIHRPAQSRAERFDQGAAGHQVDVSIHRPAQSRAEPAPTGQQLLKATVSIHRPAQSRAEPRAKRWNAWASVSIHRPAQSRAELRGVAVDIAVHAGFNPPPSTEPGGTQTMTALMVSHMFQSTAQHRAGRN